jgi:hypothetical protein
VTRLAKAGSGEKIAIFNGDKAWWIGLDAERCERAAQLPILLARSAVSECRLVAMGARAPHQRLSKAEALKVWKAIPVKFAKYESVVLSARVEGTIAIVTGRVSRVRTFGDRSATDAWYFTKFYRLSNSKWRVIAFHASDAAE